MHLAKPYLFVAILILAAGVGADEVAVPCNKDITLYQDREGNISNGGGQHLFVGKTLRGPLRRTLLAFDLADRIPSGATISAVRLSITVSQTQGGPQTILLHRMLNAWGEGPSNAHEPEGQGIEAEGGDATWLHDFYPDSFWETPGGDFAAAESAAFTIDGGGAYTWESAPGLVADVQGWLDEPQRNFGWIILGNEVDPKTAKRIFAREHATTSRRPVLHISFDRDAATAVELDSWGAIKAE